MERGKFITLEGGERAGKTTQARLLEQWLTERGIPVLRTREPGGVALAEQIRRIIFGEYGDEMDLTCELLLFYAARAQIVKELIKPTLDSGKWIVCDRFHDSSAVIQGYVKGANKKFINELNKYVIADYIPDLTIYIDTPSDILMSRTGSETNRHDIAGKDFHDKVRKGFCILAEKEPQRIRMVDGRKPLDKVFNDITYWITEKLL